MNIETLGSLGEFIGSIAVLVTLIYLAIQTRQSVKASQQKSHSDILARRQQLFRLLTEDREFIEIWGKGCTRQPLDAIDAQRFTTFAVSFASHVQDAYVQHRAGLISEEIWEAELSLLAPTFTQPGFRDWWEHGQQFLTSEFVAVVEEAKETNLVLYDPQTQKWGRPTDGKFAQDISTEPDDT